MRTSLRDRLGDVAIPYVWSDDQLDGFIDSAVTGLYPVYYNFANEISEASGSGPLYPTPAGARNLYRVGLMSSSSSRIRWLRGWSEGNSQCLIPKTNIAGYTIVWCWTEGFEPPVSDTLPLGIPLEAEEVVLLRSTKSALEALLGNRVLKERYYSLNARVANTEDDIALTIDSINASIRERTEKAIPLPKVNS